MSEVKQEPDSIRSRIVILVGTGALIAFGIGIGWAAWIQKDDTGSLMTLPRSRVEHVGDSEVGMVYMKPFDEDYAKRSHTRDLARLKELGWADKEKGVAHIPIDRAIKIFLERGGKL